MPSVHVLKEACKKVDVLGRVEKAGCAASLDVSKDVFRLIPMNHSRILAESGEGADVVGDVWTCADCEVEERADELAIWFLFHLFFFLISCGH